MKLQVLGIDLGKTVFHLVGADSTGRVVIRKRCSRTQLLAFTREFAGAVDWHGGL
jgi:transposase